MRLVAWVVRIFVILFLAVALFFYYLPLALWDGVRHRLSRGRRSR